MKMQTSAPKATVLDGLRAAFLALTVVVLGAASTTLAQPRSIVPLDAGWRFIKGDVVGAENSVFDDSGWQAVSLPHTFNADAEGADRETYKRGPAWYRRDIALYDGAGGQRTFIEFDGAALVSQVWVNGAFVGRHDGGYARFRFDVTPYLRSGKNTLAVRVDNSRNGTVAPLGGDFTQFGGLYRPVRLVRTSGVHFDMLYSGSSGVYLTSTDVSGQQANLAVTARIANQTGREASILVSVRLKDASGRVVLTMTKVVTVAAGAVIPVTLTDILENPHLWQGRTEPYLYTAHIELRVPSQKQTEDVIDVPVGFRDITFDPNRGLLLNGKPYEVRGPNLHLSMRPGKTVAVSATEIAEDIQMFVDMGATGLRLAHYQHEQETYDLADREGLLIWTEAPLVSEISGSRAFLDNASQQLKELIRQNYNHPSVFVWGLGNEIYKVDADSANVLNAMQALAHAEDATRPTTYANCCAPIDEPQASHTDVIASNVYFGWYSGEFTDLGPWLDENHAKRPMVPQAVSEYGAGASSRQQEQNPNRPEPGGHWHPEQYQAAYHEAAWRQLRERPFLWAKFFWVGFDFPSVGRDEGDTAGFNDKGLITYDRKTRKDAYFWYQANWSANPMVYLTSRRDWKRTRAETKIKVYSNAPYATLTLNGEKLDQVPVFDHVATWSIRLRPGRNVIHIMASNGASDGAEFYLDPTDAVAAGPSGN